MRIGSGLAAWVCAACLGAGLLAQARPAEAALVLQTSRAGQAGDDFVDWGALGGDRTVVPNPFVTTSDSGLGVTGSMPGGPFVRLDQGNGWAGNFASGDRLLWNVGASQPVRIAFASLVAGAGAQIQNVAFGPFTAVIEAFGAAGDSLGSFTLAGNSTSAGDGSAIFLGLRSDALDISYIEYGMAAGTAGFALNRLDINTAVVSVPEPASFALLGMGVLGLGLIRRRRGSGAPG